MDINEADRIQGKLRDERKPQKLKKFYKKASVKGKKAPFSIALDGMVMKTPLKATLEIPSRALAKAIAGEWNAQEEFVEPNLMYLTKYANTAIDRVETRKDNIVDEIVAFASSDMVCYRANTPQGLVDMQASAWDRVLEWASERHGLNFICVAGIVYASQPEATLVTAHGVLSAHDAYMLTAIHNLTTLTGSALLAMAVVEGAITDDEGWSAAHVDEDWNISQWGDDDEAIQRRTFRKTDMMAAVHLLETLDEQESQG